jgi:hypothetical protein
MPEPTPEEVAEVVAALREVAGGVERTRSYDDVPPWKTPEGRAARARQRRNKAQRQARKRARRS